MSENRYIILVLNPATKKVWMCRAIFIKLTDALPTAREKAKKYHTTVWITRVVLEITHG